MDEKQLNNETEAQESYDATLEEDVIEEKEEMTEEELQKSLLDDTSLNSFQKKCAMLKDSTWMKIQIAAGIVMGAITAVALFWNELTHVDEPSQSMFSVPLVIALVVALAGPNIIEKQTGRKIPKGRVVLAIALAVAVVAFFLVSGIRSGFKFN